MSEKMIQVSVILPCLDEEPTVGVCVEKARKYFMEHGILGEVIVVDNGSKDRSPEVAAAAGARVVAESVRGYGAAYLRGFKEARGNFIVMADADDTYDLSRMGEFLKPLEQGYDLVMGSRFTGKIRQGAMPWANRYIGNPILTGLYRLFFRTGLSDIHCGMRSFTREACQRLRLHCLGMEFASEMILEASQQKLRITEVPIEYHPRRGSSKLDPFIDAWRHLRFMLLFCPTWLYGVPGALLAGSGFLGMIVLVNGPVNFLGHAWDIHMLVLAAFLGIFGYQLVNIGLYAKMFAVQQAYLDQDPALSWCAKHLRLETGIMIGGIFFVIGFVMDLGIFIEWWKNSFGPLYRIRESIAGMTFMILGLQTVFSSFFLSLLNIRR